MDANQPVLYSERLNSNKTLALFVFLTGLFAGLALWRIAAAGFDGWAILLAALSLVFLFYVFNYRTLLTTLTAADLTLKFGVFRWRIPLDNVAACRLDHIAGFMYYGGAGVHFMMVEKRYRASFNFLEYPRVVIALTRKSGPVQDISFSTQYPEELIRQVNAAIGVVQKESK